MYNHTLIKGSLSKSAKQGVIQLIPKKGKLELELRNWRPLTMLCYDYKILARILAMRMEAVNDKLISSDQNGFLWHRSTQFNIRTVSEVIAYANKAHRPLVIATIDFEKCFDRVEFKAIRGALAYFGFSEWFIRWTDVLFGDFELCTQNGGFLSNFFSKTRGCAQGCPYSPTAFLYCSEVMAHLIKQNSNVKGISIHRLKKVLSQFADDTSMFLNYEQMELESVSQIFMHIEQNIGLHINYEKTTLYRVGSLANCDAKIYTSKEFAWSNEDIALLGVHISCTGECVDLNFQIVMQQVNAVIEHWYNQTLTLMGKVTVINTLLASLFVYKMSVMENLTKNQLKEIDRRFHAFLWSSKTRGRIALNTLKKSRDSGGLKLTDIAAKQKALKVSWITKINRDPFLLECMYAELCPHLRERIWQCNLYKKDVSCTFPKSYWREVLTTWCELNYKSPQGKQNILKEIVWYNSHLKAGDNVLFYSKWYPKIVTIGDLVNSEGMFIDFNEIKKICPEAKWFEYLTIRHSIPPMWKYWIQNNVEYELNVDLYDTVMLKSNLTQSITSFIYNMFIDDQDCSLYKYWHRWLDTGLNCEFEEYKAAFTNLYDITKTTKYRDFQYRLLLGKIVLNRDLKIWKIKDSALCDFCKTNEQNVIHLLWDCLKVQNIYKCLQKLWYDKYNLRNLDFSCKAVILNKVHDKPYHIVNFVILFVKHYIHVNRCLSKPINQYELESKLEYHMNLKRFLSKREGKFHKFCKKWGPIQLQLYSLL